MSTSGRTPRLAVIPGSFDPFTNGHLDLVERATRLFDHVVVAVLVNEAKTPLFTAAERVAMIRRVVADRPQVEVETFDGLLVDYARGRGAVAIVKGLRTTADFAYESPMALMNHRLAPEIETVFLMPAEAFAFTSSTLIKEVARLGGDVGGLVPPLVHEQLRRKLEMLRNPHTAPRQV